MVSNEIISYIRNSGVEWCPGNNSILSRLKKATHITEEYGTFPKEIRQIITVTADLGIFGAFAGIAIHSKNAYVDFMHNSRASQFSSHLDAKTDLTNRMQGNMFRGGIYWSLRCVPVGFTFSVLSSFIPVLRNRIDGAEYLIGGAVSGTLAGYLFSDSIGLGFVQKNYTEKNLYKKLCVIRGLSYGLALGLVFAIFDRISSQGRIESQLREWEDFWKRNQTKKNNDVVNNRSDSK